MAQLSLSMVPNLDKHNHRGATRIVKALIGKPLPPEGALLVIIEGSEIAVALNWMV